jgi:hypothetical protein
MRLIFFISLGLFLNACSSLLIEDEHAYIGLNEDAWIALNEPLTVTVEEIRIFIQRGQVIHNSELDLYAVDCELEMQTLSDKERLIQPDRFDIKKISQESSPIVMASPYQIASLQQIASSPADIKRSWIFYLHSEKQPEVRALICRGVQNPEESARLPELEEMQAALGDLITLYLTAKE